MVKINNKIDFDVDFGEVEKRKDRIRKIWNYERVDHIPIVGWVMDNPEDFTLTEIYTEKEKNLRFDLNSLKKSWELIPDDYIPFLKPEVGCITVPTILGSKASYNEGFDKEATVVEPIITKIEDLEKIHIPLDENEIIKKGLMPVCLEKIDYYLQQTKGAFSFTGFDLANVMNGCIDMMDSNLFYMSLVSEKDRMLRFITKLSELYLKVYSILIREVGDINNMTTTDFDWAWFPEGYKGYTSDDPCANFGPDIFETFSKPFNKKIYDKFGYGGLHNCGPHPSVEAYMDYDGKKLKAINCAAKYTYGEIDKFFSALKGSETLIYFLYQEEFYNPQEIIELHKKIVEKGVEYNLICIASYYLSSSDYSDNEITDTFAQLIKINEEYADSMKLK